MRQIYHRRSTLHSYTHMIVKHDSRRHYWVMMVALFFFLCSVYLLTYNVALVVNDELQMIDLVGSMVDFGDEKYDLSLWYVWDKYGSPVVPDENDEFYPLVKSVIEPGYMYVGTVFYRLASFIPNLGVVHVLWLSNTISSALLCVVLFYYARLLGYDDRTALLAALALGLCTIVWPYTQTFLRESLSMLLLLGTAYLWEKARRGGWKYFVVGSVVLAANFVTKEPVLLALPGLLLILVPDVPWLRRDRLVRVGLVAALAGVLALTLIMIYTDVLFTLIPHPTRIVGQHALIAEYAQVALHTYLLSPGGSIWGTSPILILALPGAWMLWRREQYRYVWVMVLALVGFAVGHALLSGAHWFGGPMWPPRYLVPVVPLVFICALPALGALLKRPKPVWLKVAIGALVVYSLWWQFNGVALSWYDFGGAIPPEAHHLSSWGPGLNQLRYLRPVVMTPLWFEAPLKFTWVQSGVWVWPVVFGGFALTWGAILWRGYWGKRPYRGWIAGLALVFVGVTLGLLTLFYRRDPEFLGDNAALHEIAAILDVEEQPGDVLLINDPKYERFFLNRPGFDHTRVVTLSPPPGERGSFEQPPAVVSDDVNALIPNDAPALIHALAAPRERLWVLMETGPFVPWSIRPLERFMALYYYPLRELQSDPPDPAVRLLEYCTIPAPEAGTPPEYSATFVFGDAIDLRGFTLPAETTYAPGEALPVTLYWQANGHVETSYVVALFLADMGDGIVAQGMDSVPHGGFMSTDTWKRGEMVQDNRALRLPHNLPPGDYALWVRLYAWDAGEMMHLPVTGETVVGETVAVLPVTILVEP